MRVLGFEDIRLINQRPYWMQSAGLMIDVDLNELEPASIAIK